MENVSTVFHTTINSNGEQDAIQNQSEYEGKRKCPKKKEQSEKGMS